MDKIFVPLAIATFPKEAVVPVHFARETYILKLLSQGLEPMFVSGLFPQEVVDRIYAECGGVLLMGGGDVDPTRYRSSVHPKTEIENPTRETLEFMVTKRALADRKPFLGICRGCQVLAVAAGGTLHQHVPEVAPEENHGVTEGGNYDDLLRVAQGHEVIVESGSQAWQLIGKDRIAVNSGHHQAVDDPGKDLRVAARSPRGITEIIEHTDRNYFCFGIQSHPECCGTNYPDSRELGDLERFFAEFAGAVKEYSPHLS